jgi:rhomboid domain-containing protein 1
LKVLVSAYSVSRLVHLAPGVVVPSNWAYWLELVLIQVMVPNASFIGHLAGILVGLLFVRGPLKFVMDLPFMVFTGRRTPGNSHFTFAASLFLGCSEFFSLDYGYANGRFSMSL